MGGENRFMITRARKELGFSPQVNLAQGVREGIAWYRRKRAQQLTHD
jgi:nucleoside-diphosphate-sugar epimerase